MPTRNSVSVFTCNNVVWISNSHIPAEGSEETLGYTEREAYSEEWQQHHFKKNRLSSPCSTISLGLVFFSPYVSDTTITPSIEFLDLSFR
jgi:hypothetical protein